MRGSGGRDWRKAGTEERRDVLSNREMFESSKVNERLDMTDLLSRLWSYEQAFLSEGRHRRSVSAADACVAGSRRCCRRLHQWQSIFRERAESHTTGTTYSCRTQRTSSPHYVLPPEAGRFARDREA